MKAMNQLVFDAGDIGNMFLLGTGTILKCHRAAHQSNRKLAADA